MSEDEASFKVREKRRFKEGSEGGAPAPDTEQMTADVPGADSGPADAAASESDMGGAEGSSADRPEDVPSAAPDVTDFLDGEDFSEAGDPSGGAMPDISTAGFMQFMLANLYQLGWQNLGLVPNQVTGKVEANLPDARLAIDGYGALLSVLSPRLDEVARREMQTALSNLRINFMEQSKRQGEEQ